MENRWMAWGLAAVLALQVYTLAQIGDLQLIRRQVGGLESQISQVGNRVNNLDNHLTMMARANEWLVNPRIQVDDSPGCGEANVTVDWTLKEVEPGSKVEFLYRTTAEKEWRTVEATPTGAGSYRAGFTVTGSVTASPSIQVEGPTGRGGTASVTESAREPMRQYEYRIVSKSGEKTRSSEAQSLDVNKAFVAWFRISAMVRPDGYRVNLTRSLKPGTHQCTVVTEARAKGIAGDRVVVESPLQVDANPEMMWTELTTKERMERIDVVVKYAAGNEETHTVYLSR